MVQDSKNYYSRKYDSRESAAQKILLKLREVERSRPRNTAGANQGPTKTQATAVATTWKSQLKEHYDKSGMAGEGPKYNTVEVQGGFVASVRVPRLGMEVKGDKKKNKKEAEQSAAEKAIRSLNKLK
jgi:dsRNA-specific ribonuclease